MDTARKFTKAFLYIIWIMALIYIVLISVFSVNQIISFKNAHDTHGVDLFWQIPLVLAVWFMVVVAVILTSGLIHIGLCVALSIFDIRNSVVDFIEHSKTKPNTSLQQKPPAQVAELRIISTPLDAIERDQIRRFNAADK